mmetsp:Transcript_1535/g.2203  ORF Transcript_1535/g.2203 Transcript_1535/m.2203 type:complete len:127 (+) Transcript_1535:203-583(+)
MPRRLRLMLMRTVVSSSKQVPKLEQTCKIFSSLLLKNSQKAFNRSKMMSSRLYPPMKIKVQGVVVVRSKIEYTSCKPLENAIRISNILLLDFAAKLATTCGAKWLQAIASGHHAVHTTPSFFHAPN